MNPLLGRFTSHTYALLRIVGGLMFALHGSQKILGWPVDPSMPMKPGQLPPIAVAAGVIELILGLLIVIGLFTSLAAFIASGEMAVAYFIGHAHGGFWPTINKGELAVLYCFVFLYIAAHDSGRIAIDRPFRRKA
jgi:putative oxidoreductase